MPPERLDLLGLREHRVRKDQPGLRDRLDRLGLLEDLLGLLGLPEPLVPQEPRALQDRPDRPGPQEPPEHRATKGLPDLPDLRAPPEQPELLPRQYMHNKENAVTMRLSAH